MRAVIQRVKEASVEIDGEIFSSIGHGLLILLGIEEADTSEDIQWLAAKITQLRIFEDENELMNLSQADAGGALMVVSQFTLFASTKKGNRPSFIRSAKPDIAKPLYEQFVNELAAMTGKEIRTGQFGAMMMIRLVNEGPVTILIDTKNKE